jgi:Domain of unknown function (DUF4112)
MNNTAARLATLNRIRKFSNLMDTAIRVPGTPFRFGLDPILGLLPFVGDAIDTGFSAYLVFLATRFQLPRHVLGWMIFNIGLEAVVGSVPLIGDIFDAFYKSNVRNLALLEEHLQATEPELGEADPLNLTSAILLDPAGKYAATPAPAIQTPAETPIANSAQSAR